jgi:alginate O-acetyltransferase complex protein AlgI
MTLQDPITFIFSIMLGKLVGASKNFFNLWISLISIVFIAYIDQSSLFVLFIGLLLLIYSRNGVDYRIIVAFCIIILAFFKTGLAVEVARAFNNELFTLILIGEMSEGGQIPSGISFYMLTVCLLAIQGDRKTNVCNSFSTAAFYPHILAGPVLHKPLEINERLRRAGPGYAAIVFSLGMFLLSSSEILHQIFEGTKISAASNGYVRAWLFYLYLFANFFGYSLLATAYAMLFGVEIPINFNAPTLAANPSEFWMRWHRSLSLLFRNYLYKWLLKHKVNASISIFFVLALSGVWHGWGWGYIIWGGVNGVLVILGRLISNSKILHAVTFILMPASWVPFFSADLSQVKKYYLDFMLPNFPTDLISIKYFGVIVIVFVISCIPYKHLLSTILVIKMYEKDPYGSHSPRFNSSIKESIVSLIGGAFLALVLYYGVGTGSEFMYQRF